jgi:hypothetical protein
MQALGTMHGKLSLFHKSHDFAASLLLLFSSFKTLIADLLKYFLLFVVCLLSETENLFLVSHTPLLSPAHSYDHDCCSTELDIRTPDRVRFPNLTSTTTLWELTIAYFASRSLDDIDILNIFTNFAIQIAAPPQGCDTAAII